MAEQYPSTYHDFLARKRHSANLYGFAPLWMPDFLFDFQQYLVDWAIRKGRAALFADCGMGKTPMQLVWAENVVRHTGRPVLILTPLSVAQQTLHEAAKFGIDAERSPLGTFSTPIVITNYERLHYFTPSDFAGVVCDESSIMKNFDGARKTAITEFMKRVEYRLLCTATAAPNDYIELGTSSECLGELGYMDMLSMFFKNDEDSLHPAFIGSQWRFKRHAERDFWRWVCSWARACRKPSDLGFDDSAFLLPPLITKEQVVQSPRLDGFLFAMPARGLHEQRQERHETITARCELAASLAVQHDTSIVWCHLNAEGDLLAHLIPGAVQISGTDSDERKEEVFTAFCAGAIRRLVTKPKIAALGLNFQHCNHMTFFPSHSFEQYYQAIRRCWRFGQTRPVYADIVTSEGEQGVLQNLQRKALACEKMFDVIVKEMHDALTLDRTSRFTTPAILPSWLLGSTPCQ